MSFGEFLFAIVLVVFGFALLSFITELIIIIKEKKRLCTWYVENL